MPVSGLSQTSSSVGMGLIPNGGLALVAISYLIIKSQEEIGPLFEMKVLPSGLVGRCPPKGVGWLPEAVEKGPKGLQSQRWNGARSWAEGLTGVREKNGYGAASGGGHRSAQGHSERVGRALLGSTGVTWPTGNQKCRDYPTRDHRDRRALDVIC